MCDTKQDKDGKFTFLTLKAKYIEGNPKAVQLNIVLHKSKFDQLTMLGLASDEIYMAIAEIEKEINKREKPI